MLSLLHLHSVLISVPYLYFTTPRHQPIMTSTPAKKPTQRDPRRRNRLRRVAQAQEKRPIQRRQTPPPISKQQIRPANPTKAFGPNPGWLYISPQCAEFLSQVQYEVRIKGSRHRFTMFKDVSERDVWPALNLRRGAHSLVWSW